MTFFVDRLAASWLTRKDLVSIKVGANRANQPQPSSAKKNSAVPE
jgi:hypothetical protein